MYYQDPVLAYYEAELARLRGELEREYYTPVEGAPPPQEGQGYEEIGDAVKTGKDIYDAYDALAGGSSTASTAPALYGEVAVSPQLGTQLIYDPVSGAAVGTSSSSSAAPVLVDAATGEAVATAVPANTAAAGTQFFELGAPSYAGYAGAALGAYNAVDNWDKVETDMKATYAQQQAALAVANVYTGGLAGVAEGLARKYAPGAMEWLDELDQKFNPITIAANKLQLFGKDTWKKERDRLRDLKEQGIAIDENILASLDTLRMGRSKDQLIEEEKARIAAGGTGSVEFAETRDEKYLLPEAVAGFALLPEKFGNEYANASLGKKHAASKRLIDAGALNEHHGTIDYTEAFTPELEAEIKSILGGPEAPTQPAPRANPTPQTGEGLTQTTSSTNVPLPKVKKRKPYKLTMPEAPEVGPASVYGNRTTEDYQEMLRQFGGPYYGQNGA